MAIIDTSNASVVPTRNMTDLTGGSASDPYTIFNNNIQSMLTTLQKTNTTGNAALGGAANALTNESITGNGQSFDPNVSSGVQVRNQQNLENAFTPAISSLNTQIENNNNALTGINQLANTELSNMKGQYTYQLNPQTGNFDSYNTNTGTWMNDGGAASGKTSGGSNSTTLVNGANFAAYNPTDPDYSKKIQGYVSAIQSQMPNGYDPTVASTILQEHKSPITPTMVSAVASSTGMDPVNILAQIGLESTYGTSNVAQEDNNPLGVTWNPSMTNAVQGTARPANEGGFYASFKTMQDGLYAGAQTLADKTNQSNQTSNSSTSGSSLSDPQGNLFYNPAYNSKVASVVSSMPGIKNYIKAGPGGVAYIDSGAASAVSPALGQAAQIASSKSGIPIESSDDMAAINDLAQYMQKTQDLVNTNLNTGNTSPTASALQNFLKGTANTYIKNSPQLTEFNSYVQGITSTVDLLKSLAGGAGSGLKITGTEIAGIAGGLPNQNDSWQDAQAKMLATNTKISQVMHTIFPDYDASQTLLPQGQTTPQTTGANAGASSQFSFNAPNGKTYTFPTQQGLSQFQNAIIKALQKTGGSSASTSTPAVATTQPANGSGYVSPFSLNYKGPQIPGINQ